MQAPGDGISFLLDGSPGRIVQLDEHRRIFHINGQFREHGAAGAAPKDMEHGRSCSV